MGVKGFKKKIAGNREEIKDFLRRHKDLRKRGLKQVQSIGREVQKI